MPKAGNELALSRERIGYVNLIYFEYLNLPA
jgi:hypothetical protein